MRYVTGDILESDADAIVIPVNCIGVMGAGLAKQLADKYHHVFCLYADMCNEGHIKLGSVAWGIISVEQQVVFFPTKFHFVDKSEYIHIERSLWALRWSLNIMPWIKSIAIPKVGCGLGGLDWRLVRKLIEKVFGDYKMAEIIVYGEPAPS